MVKEDIDCILRKADIYLEQFGNKYKKRDGGKMDWFDMSHLLSCLFPEYTKEELLETHIRIVTEDQGE